MINSLFNYSMKKVGLFFSFLFIILLVIVKFNNLESEIDLTYINYYILFSISIIVFSKEKIDDERTTIIRNYSIKSAFVFLYSCISLLYILKSDIKVIYFAIASMFFYLVIFTLLNYFNPDFLFKKEKVGSKSKNFIVVVVTIFMAIAMSYDTILSLLDKL